MCHYIVTSLKDKVGTIILNDPEKRNALSKAMASELCQALESYRFNPDVRWSCSAVQAGISVQAVISLP